MPSHDLTARLATGAFLALLLWQSSGGASRTPAASDRGGQMDAFKLSQVIEERRRSGDSWLEFLRVPALSVGLYALPAGAEDPQDPHTEDEVYYVVGGRGLLRVGEADRVVEPGAILFVGANVRHRFHSLKEDLTTLVFFAPAEGSRAKPAGR